MSAIKAVSTGRSLHGTEESMMHRRILGAALAVALVGISAATAVATPAGTNGQIVWQQESQNAPPHLWVANPDGSQAREVFAEDDAATFDAAFSPLNAGALAFTHATQKPFSDEIFVGDLATGQVRQLTNSKNASVAPTFSPDGNRIAFFSVRPPERNRSPGPERIAVINLDGTGRQFLTPKGRSSIDPDFSPDGTRIAYSESRPVGPSGVDNRLMVMNTDGSHRRAVTAYGGRREINPKWLPDGSGLLFESLNRRSLKSNIERIGLDGSGRRTVLATPAFETNPVPSPDGTRILFTSDRDRRGPTRLGPGFEVYTMKLDGTDIVRFTNNKERDIFPDWQRLP
jgi:Tol biopolymer transport system component